MHPAPQKYRGESENVLILSTHTCTQKTKHFCPKRVALLIIASYSLSATTALFPGFDCGLCEDIFTHKVFA